MQTEKKLRYSRQREMVYQYLMGTKAHPSAEMIYEDLKGEIAGLSLATVYRNLKLLEDLGKVRRVASYQGSERYDANCADHVHFLCRCCGGIYDMDHADTDSIRAAVSLGDGFSLEKLDLTLTGTCPDCAG